MNKFKVSLMLLGLMGLTSQYMTASIDAVVAGVTDKAVAKDLTGASQMIEDAVRSVIATLRQGADAAKVYTKAQLDQLFTVRDNVRALVAQASSNRKWWIGLGAAAVTGAVLAGLYDYKYREGRGLDAVKGGVRSAYDRLPSWRKQAAVTSVAEEAAAPSDNGASRLMEMLRSRISEGLLNKIVETTQDLSSPEIQEVAPVLNDFVQPLVA